VPQTPIQPLQDTGIFAGPSTGTRSQVQWTNPTFVMTDATPGPSGSGNGHDAAALDPDVDMETRPLNFLQPRTLTNKRSR